MFLEARQAFIEESFAPLADDLTTGVEPSRDLIILKTFGGQKDDLGAHNLKVR